MRTDETLYISLTNEAIWEVFQDISGVFRGGGNATSPKLMKSSGPRSRDFKLETDESGKTWVLPDPSKGLSFSSTVERLQQQRPRPITGWIYRLPRHSKLPVGLCVNYHVKDPGHPMIGVTNRISADDLVLKFNELATLMIKTNEKI